MKEKLIQFMQGRYGIDTLNNHALFFVIALFILNIFFNNKIIMSLGYLIWLLVIYLDKHINVIKKMKNT